MKKTRADIDKIYRSKLTTPLVFGDPEQIKLLNAWREEIDEFERLERERNDPVNPLREWRVSYTYRVEGEDIVEAYTCE